MRLGRLLVLASLFLMASVAPAGDYPPGIMFSTLLNNVKLQPKEGYFRLDNQMQGVFLPAGSSGKVVLRKADGKEVMMVPWTEEPIKAPYSRLDFKIQKNMITGQDDPRFKLTEPGSYVLDFYLADKVFYTYPFTVRTVGQTDPFAGGGLTMMDGAWNDWGYLMIPEKNVEQMPLWKIWLRHENPESIRKDCKMDIQVVREKDKKLICVSREGMSYSLSHDWVRYQFDLINPPVKTSGGEYYKAKDLLAVDSDYTLTMKIDGAVYGVWKFKVVGGQLNYVGRTERGKADPLTFVEGGRDAWWYEKGKK